MSKAPPNLETYRTELASIDQWVKDNYPEGKQLTWKLGKFKGRKCVIRGTTWESPHWRGTAFEVFVLVATYRMDGRKGFKGCEEFVDDGDNFHRTYREISHWFEPEA